MPETAGRVLGEHREVCAFLMHMLLEAEATATSPFTWVDLGCGDGRVLLALRDSVPDHLRRHLCYRGFDRDDTSAAMLKLESGGLHPDSRCEQVDLSDLQRPAVTDASLVTLTNVIHEVSPLSLPSMLLLGLQGLRSDGYLLAYDMQRLPEDDFRREWEAVPWRVTEIAEIAATVLEELRARETYVVGEWRHMTTTGWTLAVPRRILGEDPFGEAARATAEERGRQVVTRLLRLRLTGYTDKWDSVVGSLANLHEMSDSERALLADDVAELPRIYQARYALSRAVQQ